MPQPEIVVAAACADLLFAARIRAAAEAAGSKCVLLGRADPLAEVLAAGPGLLLLDLDAGWLDVPGLIAGVRKEPGLRGVRVVAFGPHVRGAALAAARAAGADLALARSAFVRVLPELLRPS